MPPPLASNSRNRLRPGVQEIGEEAVAGEFVTELLADEPARDAGHVEVHPPPLSFALGQVQRVWQLDQSGPARSGPGGS